MSGGCSTRTRSTRCSTARPATTEFRKLRKRIVRLTREAIETYGMVRAGERWLVCLSGGKDSYTLLAALVELQWRGLLPVELLACNLDQGQPGFPATVLPEFLARMGVPHRIEYRDTYSIVTDKVPAGPHLLRALLAAAARAPLPHRPGGGLRGGRARPPPRRHPRDLLPQPLPRRQAGGDAAEAPERRGRRLRAAPAGPRRRGRLRALRRARWATRSSPATSAAARTGCSAGRSRRCSTTGRRRLPGRRQILFRALTQANPSHLLDPALFDFKGL